MGTLPPDERNEMKTILLQIVVAISIVSCKAEEHGNESKNPVGCPLEIGKSVSFPHGTQIFGTLASEKYPLRGAGINLGQSADPQKRVFSEEVLDDWISTPDSTYLLASYGAAHEPIALKCNYAAKGSSATDNDPKSVVLLIPLPQGTPVECIFVRKQGWKRASCLVKQ